MSFFIILFCLLLLILLISYFKVDAFLSLVIISIAMAIFLGIPLSRIPAVVEKGIGNILGNLTLIIVLGAMLGKLVAESGAAQKIAEVMVNLMGTKNIQWGLMIAGFIVGIPLFYGVGFVLLVPIIFSIVYQYKFPAVYIGLPMIAALSVAHGFLPPHPSPVALVSIFNANMGITLILGIVISIPAIIIAGPVFSKTLKNIKTGPLKLFNANKPESNQNIGKPGKANSFLTATLPVFLLIIATTLPYLFPNLSGQASEILTFVSAPSTVMLLSVAIATYTLGIRQGRKIKDIMLIYTDAVKDIAMILLIIAGSGPTDRNGNGPTLNCNTYKMLSDLLNNYGIATLSYDKRLVAKSVSKQQEVDLRFEDYIEDAKSWIDLLSKNKQFSEIIVIGHSEGSLIGMIASVNNPNVSKYISIAGVGVTADEILKEQLSKNLEGQSEKLKERALSYIEDLKQGKLLGEVSPVWNVLFRPSIQPYLISWFKYNPQEEIKKLNIPILIVQGTLDVQVSEKEAELLHNANPNAKKVIIENMNHVLKNSQSINLPDQLKDSYNNPDTPINKELVETIVAFLIG